MFNACMTIRTNLQHHNEMMVAKAFFAFRQMKFEDKSSLGVSLVSIIPQTVLKLKEYKYNGKILM